MTFGHLLVALAVRGRAHLVEPCLLSTCRAFGSVPRARVVAWLDPLDDEVGVDRLLEWGADEVVVLRSLDPAWPPKRRVNAMRRDAAGYAVEHGFDAVQYLDSDVVVSRGFATELGRLWPAMEEHGCGALSLANCELYERKHVVQRLPEIGASVRRYGMGACLAFPVGDKIAAMADWRSLSATQSWDTHFSTAVAGQRVLTSDVSHVRHDGKGTGMMKAFPDFDFKNLAEDLR